jgi:membrane protein implicated in regulation of membrane protease activity
LTCPPGVKPLLTFFDRQTIATIGNGVAGVFAGAAAVLLKALHFAAGVAADLTIFLSLAVAFLSCRILLWKWNHRRRLEKNSLQRMRHAHDEEFEEPPDEL